MDKKLEKTFQLWPGNAEQLIRYKEGLMFLNSMKGDWTATFGSYDKLLASKLHYCCKRLDLQFARH